MLVCALAVGATAAHAADSPSLLATPLADPATVLAVTSTPGVPQSHAPRLDAVGYQKRRSTPYSSAYTKPVQIHGGAFQAEGETAIESAFGIRGGPQLADRLQMGVMVDWLHRTNNTYTPVATPYSAAGQVIAPERINATTKTDLIPVMAFMQVGTSGGIIVPYAGVAGGYEWLYLAAEDFVTTDTYYANFSGWGWQAWAGLGLPLGESIRLNAEVFHNGSVVERELKDASDVPYKERVDVSGDGVRVGLCFGF
jgi:hypothetical protein